MRCLRHGLVAIAGLTACAAAVAQAWRLSPEIQTTVTATDNAAYVEGKYGLDGLYVGVPCIIGAGGVEQIVEIALDDEAKGNLQVSVDAVKELLVACKAIDPGLS